MIGKEEKVAQEEATKRVEEQIKKLKRRKIMTREEVIKKLEETTDYIYESDDPKSYLQAVKWLIFDLTEVLEDEIKI